MSSIKIFWKNSAIYGISSIMVRSISFLLLPLYTNSFSKDETGYIFLIFTFIAFAQVVYHCGIDSAFLQYYKDNASDKDSVGRTVIISLILTSIIFSSLIIFFSDKISIYFLGIENGIWFQYCGWILLFDAISSRMMMLIRIQERTIIFLIISIINVISTILASYFLVVSYKMGINGILIGTLIGSILKWLMLSPALIFTISRGVFSFSIILKLLKFGLPFFPAAIFYLLLELSDRFILFWILGPESVGIYSVGYKIGSLALFIITAFNLGWQPFYIKHGNNANAGNIFGNIGTIFIHFLIIIWGLITFWTPVLMRIKMGNNYLIGQEFWASEQVVSIIFFSYLFYAGYIVLMPSIYLLEKQNWSPIFRGTAALLNIILNCIFITYWGLIGAAFSTLISYLVMFLFIYYKSNKWIKIYCNWNGISKHLLITSIFILCYFFMQKTLLISISVTLIYLGILFVIRGKMKIYNDYKYIKSSFKDA